VISRGQTGPIEFEIKFRSAPYEPLVTYELHINLDDKGLPIVSKELLKYRRGQKGRPWHFLDFSHGVGHAIVNESDYGKPGVQEAGNNKPWIRLIFWLSRDWANFKSTSK
jgi:predicted ATPase